GDAFEEGAKLLGIADSGRALGDVLLAEFGQDAHLAITEVVEALRIGARDPRTMQIAVDDEADLAVDLHGLGLRVVDHHAAVTAIVEAAMSLDMPGFMIESERAAIPVFIAGQRGIGGPKQTFDMVGSRTVGSVDDAQEHLIELAVVHVDMTGNELAGRIELEQNA